MGKQPELSLIHIYNEKAHRHMIHHNLVTNLVMMYHVAVCFFIVYGMHSERDKEKVRREMFFMAKILAFLITVFAAAGLLAAFQMCIRDRQKALITLVKVCRESVPIVPLSSTS